MVTDPSPRVKRTNRMAMPSRMIGIEMTLNGVSSLPCGFISFSRKRKKLGRSGGVT